MIWKLSLILVLEIFSYVKCYNERDIEPSYSDMDDLYSDLEGSVALNDEDTKIFDDIIHERYMLAENKFLNFYPNLRDFPRMKAIFEKVIHKDFFQLKNFANKCHNKVIKFNALYVLLKYDIHVQIENSLLAVVDRILWKAIRDNDFQKENADLILKDLLELGGIRRHDDIVWDAVQKIVGKYKKMMLNMAELFDRNGADENKTSSVVMAKNHYFHQLSDILKNLHPEENGQVVAIENGKNAIAANENETDIVITNYDMHSPEKMKWYLEPLNHQYVRFKQYQKDDKYLCLKISLLEYGIGFGSKMNRFCIWKIISNQNEYYIYNPDIKKYLCISVDDGRKKFEFLNHNYKGVPENCKYFMTYFDISK